MVSYTRSNALLPNGIKTKKVEVLPTIVALKMHPKGSAALQQKAAFPLLSQCKQSEQQPIEWQYVPED
jgi:hypothetical protein